MYADENVIKIKHAVLLEVAKAAFAGNLDEIRDDIPFTLIPWTRHLSSVAVSTRREKSSVNVSDLQRVKHQAQTMTAISSR